MVPVEVASLNFHPFKLNGVDPTFLISINSALGKPTTGEGSAMISVIKTSNRSAVCALEIKGRRMRIGSSFLHNIRFKYKKDY
jgi:hypothetical protein